MELQPILDTPVDPTFKGVPGDAGTFLLRETGQQGWNVLREDLPLPLMVLKQGPLDNNAAVMRTFLEEQDVLLAPHGKTTMCPQIFDRQLRDGAWAMTAATVSQIQVYRRFGSSRIILANQLVGRKPTEYIVKELNRDPEFDFYCWVDSAAQVEQMARMAQEAGLRRPIQVLLEMGLPGGRTGCRTVEEALEVVAAIKRLNPGLLALCGVGGFEGVAGGDPDDALRRVDRFLESFRDLLERLRPEDFPGREEILLSAGGSAYFDRVAAILKMTSFSLPIRLVLRSGCYFTHDSASYDRHQQRAVSRGLFKGGLQPSIEIWSYVQSLPEPSLALLTMGKRDCPYDAGLPVPERLYRPGEGWIPLGSCEITSVNDQHAYLRWEKDLDLRVGDMLASGISHPCTAFDKWRFIPVVDDDYNVVDAVLTFF